ncbi:MAG: DegV family protein with EDD domain [Ilumatobacter sp.]|jgi:DegV family protein with EDD domain
MIGVVVDSNSQLPGSLAERYGIEVVPLTVTVNGVDHLEGVDLTSRAFYASWDDGKVPTITTSQPSPGQFVAAYQRLAARGCTEILSVHIAEAMSGTLNSARLAAQMVDVPVRLVDSGTASFGISCCAWAAADAIADGADVESAALIAEERAGVLGTTFIVGVPQLMERSGRADGAGVEAASNVGIPVLSMTGGDLAVLATVQTVEAAVAAMTEYALGWTPSAPAGLRVAIGTSDMASALVSADLADALRGRPALAEEPVHYTIGPSVGAHTGPGTSGLFVF